ncbi:MAG: M48 family metalloprotease [Candidatus Roseilinea sp.]|uniref:M48 family metalloprotease n=1 Tax=Candidatus Roseilinea sp. TaxID=2838777 RepID=UPI004049A420
MASPVNLPPRKLNILALPSYTALLFALIALVVLGAAFSSLLPGSQVWPLPIIIGFTLLPLRDFLHRPDRHMADSGLVTTADPAAAELQQTLAGLAPHLSPAVQVAISLQPTEAHAFGTFRRRYVGLGRGLAGRLANALRDPDPDRSRQARAILAHELAHFLNRDVQLVWLAYGLLKMMVLVMAVNLVFSILLVTFVIEIGPEVARPEFWMSLSDRLTLMLPGFPRVDLLPLFEGLRAGNPTLVERLADPARQLENWQSFFLYLSASHTPFFLSGVVLWGYYWRRLLRVREFYADARTATLLGDAGVIPRAVQMHKLAARMAATASSSQAAGPGIRVRAWCQRLLLRLKSRLPEWPALQRQLAWSPPDEERQACLTDPLVAFGSERTIAVSAGLAVVLLDLVQRGTLTAQHIMEPGAYVPLLAGFAVFALWTLPRVCVGQTLCSGLWRSLVRIILWFTAIKLLMYVADLCLGLFMLATDPAGWGRAMDLWAYSMVGSLGPELPAIVGVEVTWPQILEWHVLRPMAFFGLLMPPVLSLCLAADAALKERVLSWYALDGRVRQVFWAISAGVALILALLVIPLLNRIVFAYVYQTWSSWEVAGVILAAVLGLVGGVAFWLADRRLGKRCPRCGRKVDVEFQPGLQCPAPDCHQPLHAWLVAAY